MVPKDSRRRTKPEKYFQCGGVCFVANYCCVQQVMWWVLVIFL